MNNQVFKELVQFGVLENKLSGAYGIALVLNENSDVFNGHFPDQPILPGVVMIEMTKRATQLVLEKELALVTAGNFKFLKMIDPSVITNAILGFEVIKKEDTWRVKAQIKAGEEIYFKADALYKLK